MPKIDGAAVAAALADRNQLVAFAAMVLSCDPAVTAARMGYHTHGGAISYITAAGAAKATGMPIATATRALLGLESRRPGQIQQRGRCLATGHHSPGHARAADVGRRWISRRQEIHAWRADQRAATRGRGDPRQARRRRITGLAAG
jgi:hypothetical protein